MTWVGLPDGAGGGVSGGVGGGSGEGGTGGDGVGGSGGAIMVYPSAKIVSDLRDLTGNGVQIDGSIPDRAFFVKGISTASMNPAPGEAFRYEKIISSANLDQTHSLNALSGALSVTSNADLGARTDLGLPAIGEKIVTELFSFNPNILKDNTGIFFEPNAPTPPGSDGSIPTDWVEVPLSNGTVILPPNVIWFDPQNGGTCDLAFAITKMNSDCYKSIYRFRREGGKIVEWTETPLRFQSSNAGLGNGNLLIYQYYISEAEAGIYEYMIGNTSMAEIEKYTSKYSYGKDSSAFLFLSLAGADISGGDQGGGSGGGAALHAIEGVNFLDPQKLATRSVDSYSLVVVKAELEGETAGAVTVAYARTAEATMTATATGNGASALTLTQAPSNPIPLAEKATLRAAFPPSPPARYRRKE